MAGGYYLSSNGQSCLFCDKSQSKFIDTSSAPQQCRDCLSNCKEYSDGLTCSVCEDGYLKSADSKSCNFCNLVGNFVDTSNSVHQCKPCSEGCLTCSDGNTCSKCDDSKHYKLVGSSCTLCDTSQSTKVMDTSTNPPNCKSCQSTCLTCEGTFDNCKTCPANLSLFNNTDTNKGECLEAEEFDKFTSGGITCHPSCKFCKGPSERDCRGCAEGKCISILGGCEDCPGTKPPVVNPDPILQAASLTWEVKQMDPNNRTKYKIEFSESGIFFNEKFDIYKLEEQIKVNFSFFSFLIYF